MISTKKIVMKVMCAAFAVVVAISFLGCQLDAKKPLALQKQMQAEISNTEATEKVTDVEKDESVTANVPTSAPEETESGTGSAQSKTEMNPTEPVCKHSWRAWEVIKEPSERAEGREQRICTMCGEAESRSVYKLQVEIKPSPEKFEGTIGEYNAHNLAYKDWKDDTQQAAYIEVYTVGKDNNIVEKLSTEFEKVYGFAPDLDNKYNAKAAGELVGTYIVDGYDKPQVIYRYSITDKTYIYITNDMYEVYIQKSSDGSIWVGYCIYGTMDTLASERKKAEIKVLDKEMYATFEERIGLSRNEMNTYKEKLELKIGYISEAGTVRSKHADGLVDVLYIYCRGLPASKLSE